MASPNISLLGAIYSGVSGVTLPKSGGGTATFPWVEGSQTITTNNTYDVTGLAQVVVNVAGSSGLEYETGTYTTSSNVARPSISFTKTHTDCPILVAFYDATGTSNTTSNTNYVFVYYDFWKLFGQPIWSSSSASRYEIAFYLFRSTSSTSVSANGFIITENSGNTGDSDTSYARYWVSNTGFYPYSNSTSRYWRTGRTYKWIAVWGP